ncbi:hypothetical protein ABPG72_000954 [Tetrahymena utriculariae]
MGGACTKQKPGEVSHPVKMQEVRIGQQGTQKNVTGQSDDLISIFSLKSRLSMKRQVNIGHYLVQGVNKIEKDSKKLINLWKKALSQYEKQSRKEIRKEKIFNKNTENVLFSFKKNKFNEFQSLIEQGIPLNLRWNVWKVQLFNKDIYDEQLYEKLLQQPIDEHYEHAIMKDLPRTFPNHPYFQSKEPGGGGYLKISQLNQGQMQLYNVLKALSIHMPNVGYTQGMNFVVAFLLMMSAGNENESFWIFLLLARDPSFLFMGLFEETLPLMHVLICIFEKKFKIVLPELYEYFQNILLDSMLWVWKWFITVYLYSFPIEIVAKLWDYIIINGGLSTISLGLALAEYFQKEFLVRDMEDIQTLLRDMKDTEILLDKNSKFYLDFSKLQKSAKKYTITTEFASKCVSEFVKEKKNDNMYSKFYIMRSKNETQAIEWINKSIQERVKLNAAETVMHLGTHMKSNIESQDQQKEEQVTNIVYLQQNQHILPISKQINSDTIVVNSTQQQQNLNQSDQKLIQIHEQNILQNQVDNAKQISVQNEFFQANQEKGNYGSETELQEVNTKNKTAYPPKNQQLQQQEKEEDLDNSSRQLFNQDQNVQFTYHNPQKNLDNQKNSKQPSFNQNKNKDFVGQINSKMNKLENWRLTSHKNESDIIRFTSLTEMQDDIPDHATNVDPENSNQNYQKNYIFPNSLSQKVKKSAKKQVIDNQFQIQQPKEFQ